MRFFIRADFIQDSADRLNYVEVRALVAAADIVRLTKPPFSKNQVKRSGMILDIKPVADIGAFPIDWKRLTLQGIENDQWNQLLRKMILSIVIRAVRNDSRKAIGSMPCHGQMIRSSFRCGIGRRGIV